jgi:hypothetical protein
MSTFVARLAGRAVGHPPTAQPRVPGLFETGPGSAAAQDGFDVINEQVLAGPRSTASSPNRGRTLAEDSSRVQPGAVDGSTRSDGRNSPPPPARHPSGTGGAGRDPLAPQPPRRDPQRSTSDPRALGPEPAPAGSLPVPAIPLAAGDPGSWPANEPSAAGASRRAVPAAAAEPPPVRVHIGRLEIRASLPETTPPRPVAPRVPEPAHNGPSLADYLRGAR